MLVVIILAFIAIVAYWLINVYNRMVGMRNRRQRAFADIDIQLKRRHEIVPQLVQTVKASGDYEKELLLKITEARSGAVSATTIDDKIRAEQQLSKVLQGIKSQVASSPSLKTNQQFLGLQNQLNDIEDKLAVTRRSFNTSTTEYNTGIESFPASLLASNFNFKREILFDLAAEERKEVEVASSMKA